jgi:hypothetical protein
MKRVDVYLKKLAEKRARAAGNVERYAKVSEEATKLLLQAQSIVEACDVLIREHDDRLDPSVIESIHTWKNHPKKRGDLKTALLTLLKAHSPDWLTTDEVCEAIEAKWQLKFIIPADRVEWKRNSIGRHLRRLTSDGLAEAKHDQAIAATVEAGLWRSKVDPAPSLDRLQEQVEAEGRAVRRSGAARG